MLRALVFCGALVGVVSGCTEIPFTCRTDGQCTNNGQTGWCEQNHRCSFPDDACESKRRYAPFGTDELCVPKAPACELAGVAAGANFTCVWSNAGRVSCWGENGAGQLGDGTTAWRSTPARASVSGVVEVVAGVNHACARLGDGAVSCWGENTYGQLGLGDGMTGNRSTPVTLTTITDAADLAAGGRHTCARHAAGALSCWGRNNNGQLGDGTTAMHDRPTPVAMLGNRARELAAGNAHTCVSLDDGGVSCWGAARNGPLAAGLPAMQPAPAPIAGLTMTGRLAAGDGHTCALSGGEVLCFGLNDVGQAGDRGLGRLVGPTKVAGIAGAVDLSAGANHSCARLEDGSARCWGSGAYGQLGTTVIDSGSATVAAPGATAGSTWKQLATGLRHSCGLTAAGELHCWGRAAEGQLGDGAALQWLAPETAVSGARDLTAVAAGAEHTCALTKAGAVLCWGRGDLGQLANDDISGSSVAVPVALPGPAAQVVSGNGFSCARLADGTAHCWGRGNRGQIGDTRTTDHPRPAQVSIVEPIAHLAAGAEHACAVTMAGTIYCWGDSGSGRLGNGATMATAQSKPLLVPLPPDFVRVGAGNAHTCALSRTKQISCWGASNYGQAGVGPGPAPAPPAVVAGLTDVSALAIGGDHSCVVTATGAVRCWGRGDSGQLGFGTTPSGAGLTQAVAIENFGPSASVTAASAHTCAIVGGVGHCWGSNRWGQLGTGKPNSSTRPVAVVKLAGLTAIDGGDRHSCAVLSDGTAHCWGSNQFGQLGNGAPLERVAPAKVALECP